MKWSKILVILGPTATGKSSLGVEIAKEFDGEIVSADSRQVYRGLDIGSGKITPEEMQGVPHYLLDVAGPADTYTVAQYKKDAEKAIEDVLSRDKLPILVGGTGFYIQAVVDNIVPPEVPPDEKLRAELDQKETRELFEMLQKLDPARAETIEPENKRRIIRAIEIAKHLGKVPKAPKPNPKYDVLQIGLKLSDEKLTKQIQKRVEERLKNGWVKEVQELSYSGVPKERLGEFGLGYALIAEGKENLVESITTAERQYAKRQMQWFKRDKQVMWFDPSDVEKIKKEVTLFLKD